VRWKKLTDHNRKTSQEVCNRNPPQIAASHHWPQIAGKKLPTWFFPILFRAVVCNESYWPIITAKHRKDFTSQFPAIYRKPLMTANSRKKVTCIWFFYFISCCNVRCMILTDDNRKTSQGLCIAISRKIPQ
jgi:hypothetical protein